MKPIKIGAIDSGLAFPWKHPDEWRSFPLVGYFLPLSIIGQPFSKNKKSLFTTFNFEKMVGRNRYKIERCLYER